MTQISIKHHDFIWVLKKQKQLYFPLTQNKISWGGSFLRWVIQSWLGCLSLAIARARREQGWRQKISSAEPLKSRSLEHSPLLPQLPGLASAPRVPAGHSWLPEQCGFTPARFSAVVAREAAKRKLGWGLILSRPANRPHLVTAHRKWSCRCFLRWAGCGLPCGLRLWGRLPFLRPGTSRGSVYISAAVRSPKCSPAVESQNELQTVWTELSSYICLFNPVQ